MKDMMRFRLRYVLVIVMAGLLGSCEKPILAGQEGTTETEGNLKVNVYELEQTPFNSTLRTAVSELCTHLNFAIYDMTGERLKQVNQMIGDSDFGVASFQLLEGTYQLVVIAHSSNTNPTMTNPQKIQFTNAKGYTDTFLYYETITIGSEAQTQSISLHRIVSLCRFVINDAIPEGIARLKFEYTGGSGHFSALTGKGVTNSTQVVSYAVAVGQQQTQYDLYTFLHDTTGDIHLKVMAYDAADNLQREQEFDIPMATNKITWMKGNFFDGFSVAPSQSITPMVAIDGTWGGENVIGY